MLPQTAPIIRCHVLLDVQKSGYHNVTLSTELETLSLSLSLSCFDLHTETEREHHNSLLRMDQLVAEESMETPSNQNTTEQSLRPSKKGGYRTMPFIIGNKYISISHTYIYIYIYFSYYKQYTKKSFC